MKHLILNSLLGFVVLGSLWLTYMQYIDGVYVHKPFVLYVDPQAIVTDKIIYHPGDLIQIYTSYCRYRNYTAIATWKMVDGTEITFSNINGNGLPKIVAPECVTNKLIPIGIIPDYASPGTYHLEGATQLTLNHLHTLYYTYKSINFQIQ